MMMKLLLSSILVLVVVMMVVVPSTFAQEEDYLTLDRQNYSHGDTVQVSGFIEGRGDSHVLTSIAVHPSGEVRHAGHGYSPYDSFAHQFRIVGSNWEDGIYKIVVSAVGKEFTEIFGLNYILTENDIAKYQQEQEKKTIIKQAKNSYGSHVFVNVDKLDYVHGGTIKIYGFVFLSDDSEVSPDEQVTLKIYGKNSKILLHEAKAGLNEYGEFSYYLDTSDDTKWYYPTQSEPLPFQPPRGFYYVVAEFAGLTDKSQFHLKETIEHDRQTNTLTEQTKTSQAAAEKVVPGDAILVNENNDNDEHHDAYLEWIEDNYQSTGTSVVRVTDLTKNLNSTAVDNFEIRISSGSDIMGVFLTVTETGPNTGIFEVMVPFSTTEKSSSNRLFIAEGHIITVNYKWNTLLFRPNTATADKPDVADISVTKNTTELSTRKQMTMGITADNIICNEELEKVFRFNGSALCIKPSSVEKLIQRGYITKQ